MKDTEVTALVVGIMDGAFEVYIKCGPATIYLGTTISQAEQNAIAAMLDKAAQEIRRGNQPLIDAARQEWR